MINNYSTAFPNFSFGDGEGGCGSHRGLTKKELFAVEIYAALLGSGRLDYEANAKLSVLAANHLIEALNNDMQAELAKAVDESDIEIF